MTQIIVLTTESETPPSREEIERRARENWERKHNTPFPGLKEWIRMLIRERLKKKCE